MNKKADVSSVTPSSERLEELITAGTRLTPCRSQWDSVQLKHFPQMMSSGYSDSLKIHLILIKPEIIKCKDDVNDKNYRFGCHH